MATGAGKRGKPGVAGSAMAAKEVVLKEDEMYGTVCVPTIFSVHYFRSLSPLITHCTLPITRPTGFVPKGQRN